MDTSLSQIIIIIIIIITNIYGAPQKKTKANQVAWGVVGTVALQFSDHIPCENWDDQSIIELNVIEIFNNHRLFSPLMPFDKHERGMFPENVNLVIILPG